jgi:translation initiation factor 3 subunit E
MEFQFRTSAVTLAESPHTFKYSRPHVVGLEYHNKAIMADNAPTTAVAAKTPEEVAKEHDLLPKLITHLDRHLIFPLLQFVAEQDDEPAGDITRAKYELLKKTNMTDYVASLYCDLEGVEEPPKQFATKRQEVLDRLEKYGDETEKITDLLGREDVVTSLRSDKVANLEFLKKEHDVRSTARLYQNYY